MKIAQYQSISYGSLIISEYGGDEKPGSGFVQVSEPIEVDFPPLLVSIDSHLKSLKDERDAVVEATNMRLADIDKRIAFMRVESHKGAK